METDFINLSIGKILIIRENKETKYKKEIDGNIIELTEFEKEFLLNLFNKERSYIYKSDYLDYLIENNNNIENKAYIKSLLEGIEKGIPIGYRKNLYRNLETLKTKLNFDADLSNIPSNEDSQENDISATYNTRLNILEVSPSYLKFIDNLSKKYPNIDDLYWKELTHTIVHELIHMASTYYDKDSGVALTGFDKYPTDNESEQNRGLTEAMTEVIACALIPNTIEVACSYYVEELFVNQLIFILDPEIMIKSYFGNLGTKEIEKSLNELINDEEESYNLFRRIEDYHCIRRLDCYQNLVAKVQNTLIKYFKAKIEKIIKNESMSNEEIENLILQYESMLVTPKILEINGKNPNTFVGLESSIEEFYSLKDSILNQTKKA